LGKDLPPKREHLRATLVWPERSAGNPANPTLLGKPMTDLMLFIQPVPSRDFPCLPIRISLACLSARSKSGL
jgi:hypothetical protein